MEDENSSFATLNIRRFIVIPADTPVYWELVPYEWVDLDALISELQLQALVRYQEESLSEMEG